ncbi:protein N-terminal glutamine amidohydrolase [Dichotomocladium elegans]|nr:protein N-terminal glutamine amidohydrolase [Dichotomocladium elegans]
MALDQGRQANDLGANQQPSGLLLEQSVFDNLIYTGNYCEENVYQLCKEIAAKEPDRLERCYVLFVSNAYKHVPLWKQKKCEGDLPVLWDYHVMLIYEHTTDKAFIYDQDTVLPFPCPLKAYILEAFRPFVPLLPSFRRLYRLVPAQAYLDHFASDRSHMLDDDGNFMMPPPPYDPIRTKDCIMNLHDYIEMSKDAGKPEYYGEVLSEEAFLQRYQLKI